MHERAKLQTYYWVGVKKNMRFIDKMSGKYIRSLEILLYKWLKWMKYFDIACKIHTKTLMLVNVCACVCACVLTFWNDNTVKKTSLLAVVVVDISSLVFQIIVHWNSQRFGHSPTIIANISIAHIKPSLL